VFLSVLFRLDWPYAVVENVTGLLSGATDGTVGLGVPLRLLAAILAFRCFRRGLLPCLCSWGDRAVLDALCGGPRLPGQLPTAASWRIWHRSGPPFDPPTTRSTSGCSSSQLELRLTQAHPILLAVATAEQAHPFCFLLQHRRRWVALLAKSGLPLPRHPTPQRVFCGAGGYGEDGTCTLQVSCLLCGAGQQVFW
jgi:hypothetical protein